jgi:hypothetical protein
LNRRGRLFVASFVATLLTFAPPVFARGSGGGSGHSGGRERKCLRPWLYAKGRHLRRTLLEGGTRHGWFQLQRSRRCSRVLDRTPVGHRIAIARILDEPTFADDRFYLKAHAVRLVEFARGHEVAIHDAVSFLARG